jgi:hypothetical protein
VTARKRREEDGEPTAEQIDRAVMAQVLSSAVEAASADAAYLVWTSKRGRRTRVHRVFVGNLLAVHGLMRWVRDRIDAIEEKEADEAED